MTDPINLAQLRRLQRWSQTAVVSIRCHWHRTCRQRLTTGNSSGNTRSSGCRRRWGWWWWWRGGRGWNWWNSRRRDSGRSWRLRCGRWLVTAASVDWWWSWCIWPQTSDFVCWYKHKSTSLHHTVTFYHPKLITTIYTHMVVRHIVMLSSSTILLLQAGAWWGYYKHPYCLSPCLHGTIWRLFIVQVTQSYICMGCWGPCTKPYLSPPTLQIRSFMPKYSSYVDARTRHHWISIYTFICTCMQH